MVLAFYLDPFYTPCRQQIGVDLWGGEHLPTICGRAVHILCDDDAALEDINLRKLGSFLRRTNVRTSAMSGRLLHPATWWELYGTQWPTLHFLAGRLFSLLTSSAGSKRMFKALSVVLSRTRSRTLDDKVEKQWCIAVNDKQFQRGDIIGEYARFSVEQLLIRLVDVGGLDGALGGLIVAPAGAPGAAHPLLAGVVPAPPDSAAPAPPADADPPPRPRGAVGPPQAPPRLAKPPVLLLRAARPQCAAVPGAPGGSRHAHRLGGATVGHVGPRVNVCNGVLGVDGGGGRARGGGRHPPRLVCPTLRPVRGGRAQCAQLRGGRPRVRLQRVWRQHPPPVLGV